MGRAERRARLAGEPDRRVASANQRQLRAAGHRVGGLHAAVVRVPVIPVLHGQGRSECRLELPVPAGKRAGTQMKQGARGRR